MTGNEYKLKYESGPRVRIQYDGNFRVKDQLETVLGNFMKIIKKKNNVFFDIEHTHDFIFSSLSLDISQFD